jgi:hypothetical protein
MVEAYGRYSVRIPCHAIPFHREPYQALGKMELIGNQLSKAILTVAVHKLISLYQMLRIIFQIRNYDG